MRRHQKTLAEAKQAVARVRAARGYYNPVGMKGNPTGKGKGKGKSRSPFGKGKGNGGTSYGPASFVDNMAIAMSDALTVGRKVHRKGLPRHP